MSEYNYQLQVQQEREYYASMERDQEWRQGICNDIGKVATLGFAENTHFDAAEYAPTLESNTFAQELGSVGLADLVSIEIDQTTIAEMAESSAFIDSQTSIENRTDFALAA